MRGNSDVAFHEPCDVLLTSRASIVSTRLQRKETLAVPLHTQRPENSQTTTTYSVRALGVEAQLHLQRFEKADLGYTTLKEATEA